MEVITEKSKIMTKGTNNVSASGMEVGTEKSKIMTNSTNNISADISMNGQKLEEVTRFKNLRATPCKDDICSA